MAEHDHAYKLFFSHREMVADLLRGFVTEDWVADLDLASLERVREIGVSADLRERDDDILWRVRLNRQGQPAWLYVYLLLEFQSTVDAFMAVRVMAYVALLWQDLIKARVVKPGEALPPVLPIVLYNGEAPWNAPVSLAELVITDLPVQLQHWQPQVRYLLLEERTFHAVDLAALRNLVAALFRLEQSRTPADIEQVVAALLQWLADPAQDNLRRAFVTWLKRVLLPVRVPGAEIPNVNDLQELHAMLAERVKTWTVEWKEQGLREGRQQGRQEGLQEGIQEGRQEGIQEGRQEGESRLLRRLLIRRFGPLPASVEERLQVASEARLEFWAERVLTCQTLDEVFDGLG